jgi:hypothetical protein
MFIQSLFSYLILICLLYSPTATAQLSNFENCKQNDFPINLTVLDFDPNPIEIGKNLITKISGTSMTRIDTGSIMTANFSYNGKLVDSLKFDLCRELIESSGRNCPVEPGDFNITAKSIPLVGPNYPKNSTYTFETTFTGNELRNILITIIVIIQSIINLISIFN